nr:unnamed protein product [Spirometra erinaceieuropaei]
MKTGNPVPGAPTYTHRTFCTPTMLSSIHIPPPSAPTTTSSTITTTESDTDSADFSCPHCPRTSASRIGLIDHLRIHRTENGNPVPGAPTYIRRMRLHSSHCPRTFVHRMGLLDHMRFHDNLR